MTLETRMTFNKGSVVIPLPNEVCGEGYIGITLFVRPPRFCAGYNFKTVGKRLVTSEKGGGKQATCVLPHLPYCTCPCYQGLLFKKSVS